MLESIPIKSVTVHNIFPKKDECRDFEYSFFFANRESNNCVNDNTPKTIGNRYQFSSNPKLPKYPKYTASTVTDATTIETTSEKYFDDGLTRVRENLLCIFETSSISCSIVPSRS